MAQLHYSDMEARRQLFDVNHDDDIHLQGEGYGVMSDDQKRNPNSPPEAHYQRHNAISSGYGNLDLKPAEAGKDLPANGMDEIRDVDPSGTSKEESMAKELNDQSALPAAEMNDSYFDRSGVPKEESMAEQPQDQSAERDIIDVHTLKDNYVDLSEGNTQQLSEIDPSNEAAMHDENAQFTAKGRSPVDEPTQEQITSQIHSPTVNPADQEQTAGPADDDSKQEGSEPFPQSDAVDPDQERVARPDDELKQEQTQPCPRSNDSHGCESFEGEDGREKINVEGFNIYSGEPENVVYDAAAVMSGQPENAVSGKDDGLRDMQEILGDVGHEEEASQKDVPDSQEGKAPDNLMYDAAYVMGGQPESGIVVKDDGGRDMQEVEQEEKSLPKGNADVRDVQGGVDAKQEGKPPSNVEDADVSGNLQEASKPENMVHDAAYGIGSEPGSAVNLHDDSVRDSQKVLDGVKQPLPNVDGEGVCDLQEGKEPILESSEEVTDIALECEDKASIADMKSDDQTGLQQVRNHDQPLDGDEGVDVQGSNQYKPELPNEGGEDRSKESEGKKGIAFFDEEKMAQEGEQSILNSPVVDYNTKSLPVEQGAGYGAEGFCPKSNEEVDRKLREPVDQEAERRQADEHPLDKSLQLDGKASVMEGNGKADPVVEGIADIRRPGVSDNGENDEGVNGKLISDYDKNGPVQASVQHERPPTMPHPQAADLAGYLNNDNNNNNNIGKGEKPDEAGQHLEGAPHKKGVFERIKEKLTPPYDSRSPQ